MADSTLDSLQSDPLHNSPNGKMAESEEEMRDKMYKNLMGPVDGIYLPPEREGFPKWADKAEQLRHMTLRADDVFLFTYPKSGTHWLWEVMSMLVRGSTDHEQNHKEQLMMEFVDKTIVEAMPSPRIFNTHLPFSMLPAKELKARQLKSVHVYRNPKDACVSMFYMVKSMAAKMPSPIPANTFEEFCEDYFFGSRQIYGSYFRYLKQMHEFQQQNPELPFLNISFEEVKKSPAECVRRVADFMDLAVGDELCRQIAEACSFTNMKQRAASKAMPKLSNKPVDDQEKMMKAALLGMYRKGEIGDWKNHFTVALNEKVDDLISKEMKDLPFTLTYV